jgi:hypothetical protein
VKGISVFAVVSAAIIAVVAWLLGLVFSAPADLHAVRVSAAVAYVVQLFTFAIARYAARNNVVVGWGIGVMLRFVTLVVYGFLILKPYGLPPAAALLSLVAFFFLSTLIEPVLLLKS